MDQKAVLTTPTEQAAGPVLMRPGGHSVDQEQVLGQKDVQPDLFTDLQPHQAESAEPAPK